MRFKEKVCLVTSFASGIGKAICQQLANEGAHVLLLDVQDADAAVAAEMSIATGREVVFQKTDISVYARVEETLIKAIQPWGRIDVLVNNAAIMSFKSITELSEAEWDRVMAVYMKSRFSCLQALPSSH